MEISKEIKEELNCIYNIVNKVNGKIYIGSTTVTADERINEQHIKALDKNVHGNEHLQNSWNLYGAENFYGEVVQYLPDLTQREVLEYEQYELDKIFSLPVKERKQKYYNINPLATGCSVPVSEKTRQKLIKAQKKRFKEHPDANSGENSPMWGKHHTEDSIQKMSEARTKYYKDPENRKKVSKARTKYFQEHPDAAMTGERSPSAKLTNIQADEIREKRKAGKTVKELASEYNVSHVTIYKIIKNITYKNTTHLLQQVHSNDDNDENK